MPATKTTASGPLPSRGEGEAASQLPLPPVLAPGHFTGGLFNQVMALVGATMLANLTGCALLLPELSSHVHGGGTLPFGRVFDEERFVRGMRAAGTHVLTSPPAGVDCWRPANPNVFLFSYYAYRSLMRRGCLAAHPLENATYRALAPVARLRDRAAEFVAHALGTTQ